MHQMPRHHSKRSQGLEGHHRPIVVGLLSAFLRSRQIVVKPKHCLEINQFMERTNEREEGGRTERDTHGRTVGQTERNRQTDIQNNSDITTWTRQNKPDRRTYTLTDSQLDKLNKTDRQTNTIRQKTEQDSHTDKQNKTGIQTNRTHNNTDTTDRQTNRWRNRREPKTELKPVIKNTTIIIIII